MQTIVVIHKPNYPFWKLNIKFPQINVFKLINIPGDNYKHSTVVIKQIRTLIKYAELTLFESKFLSDQLLSTNQSFTDKFLQINELISQFPQFKLDDEEYNLYRAKVISWINRNYFLIKTFNPRMFPFFKSLLSTTLKTIKQYLDAIENEAPPIFFKRSFGEPRVSAEMILAFLKTRITPWDQVVIDRSFLVSLDRRKDCSKLYEFLSREL